jgi:putative membrane protein
MSAISLAVFAAGYIGGTARAWGAAGRGRVITNWHLGWFAAGLVTLLAAALPPLDTLSEQSFAAHMLQHQLILLVAPILLSLANLPAAFAWLWPTAWARSLGRTSAMTTANAGVACLVHAIALWLWHVPRFFDAALASPMTHALQHGSFLATGVWFWVSLRHSRLGRAGLGAAVVYVFATAIESGALGALLVVSPRPWYASNGVAGARFDWTSLEDQQVAGLLMWVPASVVLTLAGLALLAAWMRESRRRVRSLEPD